MCTLSFAGTRARFLASTYASKSWIAPSASSHKSSMRIQPSTPNRSLRSAACRPHSMHRSFHAALRRVPIGVCTRFARTSARRSAKSLRRRRCNCCCDRSDVHASHTCSKSRVSNPDRSIPISGTCAACMIGRSSGISRQRPALCTHRRSIARQPTTRGLNVRDAVFFVSAEVPTAT